MGNSNVVENMFKPLLDPFLDLAFPKRCAHCGNTGSFLCPKCDSLVEFVNIDICVVCNKPSTKGFTHQSCFKETTPERYYRSLILKGPVKSCINGAVYNRQYKLLDPLIDLFIENIDGLGIEIGDEAVVVPLNSPSQRGGYEIIRPSVYMAEKFARKKNLKLCKNAMSGNSKRALYKVRGGKLSFLKNKDIVLLGIFDNRKNFLGASEALKRSSVRYIYCFALTSNKLYDSRIIF